MNLKKIAFSLLVGTGLVLGGVNVAMAAGATSTIAPAATDAAGFGLNSQKMGKGVDGVAGAGTDSKDGIITVIKNFINWTLSLLALIAFALLIYGGFTMVTAGGDEAGYKKGFTILKNAAMGLAFIALSWMIVTLIFYVLNTVAGTTA